MIVHYWPGVIRTYGATVVVAAPEDLARLQGEVAAALEAGLLEVNEAATIVLHADAALTGMDCIEYRDHAGVVLGRAKAR